LSFEGEKDSFRFLREAGRFMHAKKKRRKCHDDNQSNSAF
jgi:hypothetical protein